MTMQEYLNQKDPQRQTKVDIQKGEYETRYKQPCPADRRGNYMQEIVLNAYPKFTYIVFDGHGRLWRTDSDGNATKESCFYLVEQEK